MSIPHIICKYILFLELLHNDLLNYSSNKRQISALDSRIKSSGAIFI